VSVPVEAIIKGIVTLSQAAAKAYEAGQQEVPDETVDEAMDAMAASDTRLGDAIKRKVERDAAAAAAAETEGPDTPAPE